MEAATNTGLVERLIICIMKGGGGGGGSSLEDSRMGCLPITTAGPIHCRQTRRLAQEKMEGCEEEGKVKVSE